MPLPMLVPTRSLALALLALLGGEGGAPSFDEGLAEVHRAMQRERWEDARTKLVELLERHEGDVAVLQNIAVVREDLTRCAFWAEFERPDPKSLISGELLSWGATSGKIKLRYAPEQLDDFEQHGALHLHPLTFDGDYTVELEWKPPHRVGNPLPIVAVGMGSAQNVGVVLDRESVEVCERGTLRWSLLATAPFKSRVKLIRKQDSFEVLVDDKRALKREFEPTDYGQVVLANVQSISPELRLTITGNGQASWLQRLVDDAVREAWNEFEKTYAIEHDLPSWLLRAEERSEEGLVLPYPGPRSEAQDELWAEGLALVQKDSGTDLAKFVKERLGDACTPVFRDYWTCRLELAEGDLDAARACLERVLAADPQNVPARLLQADVLMLGEAPDEQIESLLRALLAESPALADAAVRLGRLLIHAGRGDEAVALVREALEAGAPASQLAWIQSMLGKLARGPEWSRSHEHRSAHYRVRSDIDPQTCYDATRVLENALRAYARDLGKLAPREQQYEVFIFSGEAGYQAYVADLFGSEMHNTAGLYSDTLEQLLIWNLPDREQMMQTVRHEGFHQYLDGIVDVGQVPRWLNEGLAEYYEVHDFTLGDRERGALNRRDLETLRFMRLPELDEFLFLPASRFYRAPSNYAVAWLLVHFLLHSGERARGVFDGLMGRIAAGETSEAAVRGAFAAYGPGDLQREIVPYLRALQRQ